MRNGEAAEEFGAEADLLDQYRRMVQTQAQTLNEIDKKAVQTCRLIGLLAGLILTATSIIIGTHRIDFTESTLSIFFLGTGFFALFCSLTFSIITYLNSTLMIGPSPEIGRYLADYNTEMPHYIDFMLRTYARGVETNREVILRNAERFKWCLGTLITSLILFFGAVIAVFLPSRSAWFFGSGICIVAGGLGYFVVRNDYLTLKAQVIQNKDHELPKETGR